MPRKFSEKIALLKQKEAEINNSFDSIMQDVKNLQDPSPTHVSYAPVHENISVSSAPECPRERISSALSSPLAASHLSSVGTAVLSGPMAQHETSSNHALTFSPSIAETPFSSHTTASGVGFSGEENSPPGFSHTPSASLEEKKAIASSPSHQCGNQLNSGAPPLSIASSYPSGNLRPPFSDYLPQSIPGDLKSSPKYELEPTGPLSLSGLLSSGDMGLEVCGQDGIPSHYRTLTGSRPFMRPALVEPGDSVSSSGVNSMPRSDHLVTENVRSLLSQRIRQRQQLQQQQQHKPNTNATNTATNPAPMGFGQPYFSTGADPGSYLHPLSAKSTDCIVANASPGYPNAPHQAAFENATFTRLSYDPLFYRSALNVPQEMLALNGHVERRWAGQGHPLTSHSGKNSRPMSPASQQRMRGISGSHIRHTRHRSEQFWPYPPHISPSSSALGGSRASLQQQQHQHFCDSSNVALHGSVSNSSLASNPHLGFGSSSLGAPASTSLPPEHYLSPPLPSSQLPPPSYGGTQITGLTSLNVVDHRGGNESWRRVASDSAIHHHTGPAIGAMDSTVYANGTSFPDSSMDGMQRPSGAYNFPASSSMVVMPQPLPTTSYMMPTVNVTVASAQPQNNNHSVSTMTNQATVPATSEKPPSDGYQVLKSSGSFGSLAGADVSLLLDSRITMDEFNNIPDIVFSADDSPEDDGVGRRDSSTIVSEVLSACSRPLDGSPTAAPPEQNSMDSDNFMLDVTNDDLQLLMDPELCHYVTDDRTEAVLLQEQQPPSGTASLTSQRTSSENET